MRLFSTQNLKKVNVKWEYHAIGLIWRILVSQNGLIVGEERDVHAKYVSFFCLGSDTGIPLWKEKRLSESWWVELGIVHRNVVLLHEFASPDMPEHKKIIALSLYSGKLLWENLDSQLLFAHEEKLFAAKDDSNRRIFYALSLETGNIIQEIDQSQLNVLQKKVMAETMSVFTLPKAIDVNKSHDVVALALNKRSKKNGQPVEYAEYWSNDQVAVVCYYQRTSSSVESNVMRQCIEVFDIRNHKSLYRDELITDAAVVVPDGFFFMNGSIYYVQSRKILKAVQVIYRN